ncbi:nck-associated protein 5 isoform X3 [Heterocephalus glaber]|uniref:Nck-associated protein 5 isoform X3 n=1 Tax=Heterocephalus glaber TaxID=10181 RepID=A0AAX6R7D5_HETGA|nr:nck-associated protein 5 isoform X3 [Heterocephalus glaber]
MEGKRQLEKRDFGKRLSLDSSLVEYMDSNKYIEHLLSQLEEQHRSLWREKLAVARLQREVAQRTSEGAVHEKLIHELEEERHLRLQSEKRLREVTLELERNRAQMRGLQRQFSRMEETVRNLLQSQGPPQQNKEETVSILVYREKLLEEERKHKESLDDLHTVVDEDSRSESSSTDEGKEKTKLLLERLKALEAENSALALENEKQREQYERCLDEVANQVVQALLTQKDLREECVKLKTRVFDLEQQNRTLSILFQQRVRPTSDLLLQKQQLNAKSGTPTLRCPGLGVVVPSHLCPRNSYSSSELSLSSTCSEYSSSSSYTWHDGKNLRKRQPSQKWDKRRSIDSSLPSGFASPADELPPTRIKENHILEGLRKLQKQKVLLEPSSVITKWGYKDCMNSNEGIYSPGIKSSSLKEYSSCKPPGVGIPCQESHKAFISAADSHEDADDDSSSLALLQAVPNPSCRLHGSKLTHSVSDSLFGWELSGKHFPGGTSSAYPRERPEKLTHASKCPLERQLCPWVQVPLLQRDRDPHSQGHDHAALSLQLSDTDDNETLDELHIESSDEKSPSDLSLTADTDKSMENLDILMGCEKSEHGSPDEEEKQVPTQLETRPKTFSFIKQQRVVKRTSSEECITVIFDAEDGEPFEFSSHQTGVVTVTRNEISINTPPSGLTAEHTELLPQGIAHLHPEAAARDCPFLKRSEEETKKNIPTGGVDSVSSAPTGPFSSRTVTQNVPQQKLATPTHSISCHSNSRSVAPIGICQKQNLTKIPARGKSSSQKSKIIEPEGSTLIPSSGPVTLEKSPVLPPGKFAQLIKTENVGPLCHVQPDSHIPKLPTQPSHCPKVSSRKDWAQCSKSQAPGLTRSRLLIEPGNGGEPPTRDKHCASGLEAGVTSPSPPLLPGRSVSLLVRPSYDCPSPPSSTKPESRAPSETERTVFKSPMLKGASAPIISSNQATGEVQKKKPSMAFKKPVFPHVLPSTETVIYPGCSSHAPSRSFPMITPGPPKASPKRGVPKTSPHQTLGTTHMDTGLRVPKTCPSTHEPLEILTSKSMSPGRRQLNDSVHASPKPFFLGANESPSSQVSSSTSSLSSSKSHSTPHGCQNTHEKGLKTRLPVGLKVLTKSPQLLRKSSTVPGKHEKDSLNEASKSSVAPSRPKLEDSGNPSNLEATGCERNTLTPGFHAPDRLAEGLPLETALPESLENGIPEADGRDGIENRSVKRSLSSSKPHLKPALGMNGAKARSQSFSTHSGDKPSPPAVEGPGKIRTQIITNTAERGNSLTRHSTSTEGSPSNTHSAPISESLLCAGHSFSRQGSLGSTGSTSSQHGSPSKLPLRITPKSEGLQTQPGTEDQQVYIGGECTSVVLPEEPGSDHCRCPPTPTDCPRVPQAPGRTLHPSSSETSRTSKPETSGRHPDVSITSTGAVSPEAPLPATIEEKVMLCIQENVEKGQVQTKATSVEAKPKPGPSFASWFGIRKSRLPALSSRKMDFSKTKVERKDVKVLGFGNKQLKSERKKERKKPEVQCEIENELHRDTNLAGSPDSGSQSKNNLKTSQDMYNQMNFEPRNRPSPVTCSAKDTFMTELLNRNVLKGSSQGSCLTGSSISTQGSHKKNIKTKVDMEIARDSLVKEANENTQEDEEDTITDSAFQNHVIESNCQMRTLDSGIGTFPLPDSGNRVTGRYTCQPDSSEDSKPLLSVQQAPSSASSIRAQTLEQEVPSSTDSRLATETAIVHSTSDPIMVARGMQPPQSFLPKPASSGKNSFQKQNEAELTSQTCSSLDYAEDTVAGKPLPDWGSDGTATETQKLKQVEETKEDPEHRLSKISLESFNKFNSNTVILLEKENSVSKVEGQKEAREKNEEASLSSSDRPGVDNLESLSDSLYDSFSSCASQGSNDI